MECKHKYSKWTPLEPWTSVPGATWFMSRKCVNCGDYQSKYQMPTEADISAWKTSSNNHDDVLVVTSEDGTKVFDSRDNPS